MSKGVACSLVHNSSQLTLRKVAFMLTYCCWTASLDGAQQPNNPYCSVYSVKEYHGCYQLSESQKNASWLVITLHLKVAMKLIRAPFIPQELKLQLPVPLEWEVVP